MNLENLSPNLRKKVADMTSEEIVALAREEGIELTDEQMDAIAGGDVWDDANQHYTTCHSCGNEVAWPGNQSRPKMCPYCGNQFVW